jgi:hypothetical protein
VRYDPHRIVPPDEDVLFGDPRWPVIGHFQFQEGGPVVDLELTSAVGALANPDVDVTGQGAMYTGELRIPADAQQVIAWFSYFATNGVTHWDSDYGANYYLRFTTLDVKLLERVVTSDPQTPYSGFGATIAASPAVTQVAVRFRVLNDPNQGGQRSVVQLQPTGKKGRDKRAIWQVGGVAVPYRAVIAFDIVYTVDGRSYTDDNNGRYYLAPDPELVLTQTVAAAPA